jgi:site-specific DNA-methyltransferase (adenine-specific)
MPEQLLGRIIKACSNPGETVLDPFGGSGTTLVVAKKLERRFIGFELSKNYAGQIEARLKAARSGDPLSGAEDPTTMAPPTKAGRRRESDGRITSGASARKRSNGNGSVRRSLKLSSRVEADMEPAASSAISG